MDAGDSEVTGELDVGKILHGGVEILGGAVIVDIGEKFDSWME